MNIEDFVLNQVSNNGCAFPVVDPATGKRNKFCGKEVLVLTQGGDQRAFCPEHSKFIREKIAEMKYRKAKGEDTKHKASKKGFRGSNMVIHP